MAYSMDLRQKVLAACAAGHGTGEVARRFGIGERTVRHYKQRQRESRLAADKPGPRSPTKLTADDHRRLEQLIAQQPDLTLRELAGRLGHKVAHTSVHRALKRMRLSFKKSR